MNASATCRLNLFLCAKNKLTFENHYIFCKIYMYVCIFTHTYIHIWLCIISIFFSQILITKLFVWNLFEISEIFTNIVILGIIKQWMCHPTVAHMYVTVNIYECLLYVYMYMYIYICVWILSGNSCALIQTNKTLYCFTYLCICRYVCI